mmetsp:Transcript_13113/g.27900  ORF Transcript_13113/g.27900 Transcript_13113/m.27900 type:complete len:348 (+) Transcript_13113:1203-2246(+)
MLLAQRVPERQPAVHLLLDLFEKARVIANHVVVVCESQDLDMVKAVALQLLVLLAHSTAGRLNQLAKRHAALELQYEVRRHAPLRAVREAAHHLRVAKDEDGALAVVRVNLLQDGAEVLLAIFERVAVGRSVCWARLQRPMRRPRDLCAGDDDRDRVWVRLQQLLSLSVDGDLIWRVDPWSRRVQNQRAVSCSRNLVIHRRFPQPLDLGVDIDVGLGQVGLVEEDVVAVAVSRRAELLGAHVLLRSLNVEDIVGGHVVGLAIGRKRDEDGQQRRRHLKLEHGSQAFQLAQLFLHLDTLLLGVGAVEVVSFVDDQREAHLWVVLPAKAAQLCDQAPGFADGGCRVVHD